MPRTSGASPKSWLTNIPDCVVSLSCDVLPEYREYERAVTTLVDAFVKPHMGRYLSASATSSVQACATSRFW